MRGRAVRMLGNKFLDRALGRVHLAQRQFERRLQIQQRRSVGMAGQRLLDMPQRGPRLLAFDHAVDLFDLADQIGAAELQFLAAAAGTHCIWINRHDDNRDLGLEENGQSMNRHRERCRPTAHDPNTGRDG